MNTKNEFLNRIHTKVKGIGETYECENVLSGFRYEDYGRELKKSIVTNECLEDFGEHTITLKFTDKALQKIIEQDREKESKR